MMDTKELESLCSLLEAFKGTQSKESSGWFLSAMLLIDVRFVLVQQQIGDAVAKR